MMEEMLQLVLDECGAKGWEASMFGDTLICPCGDEIELDGSCPDGCVSPLRTRGLI